MSARRGALGRIVAGGVLGLVAGCAAGPSARPAAPVATVRPATEAAGAAASGAWANRMACPAGTQRMLVAELFFGRTIGGGARPGRVSTADWDGFAADTLAHAFAAGFTVRDATGAWRDPASGRMITEATKDVVAALPDRPEALVPVRRAISVYLRRFHQHSVGALLRRACGAF